MFRLTNTSADQPILIHDRYLRRIRFRPGETKLVDLDPLDGARRIASPGVLRCEPTRPRPDPADPEAVRKQASDALGGNAVAIDILIGKAEAGDVSYNDLRSQATAFLDGATPPGKDKIIEALRARAAALRNNG